MIMKWMVILSSIALVLLILGQLIFGGLWDPLVWAALVWAIIFGVWVTWPTVQRISEVLMCTGVNALEILKRRYAAGEISREQFLEMKQDLEDVPPGHSETHGSTAGAGG